MDKEEMRRRVDEALTHIAKGHGWGPQSEFRMDFNDRYQHLLRDDPETTLQAACQQSLATVRDRHPDFEPEFDRAHFGLDSRAEGE
jgi:hypothetical protein